MLISPIPSLSPRPLNQDVSRERLPPLYMLILDADKQSRSYLKRIGSQQQFIVAEADDVGSARAIMKRQAVDLILLDPETNVDHGESFLDEIKALHPETNVIVLAPRVEKGRAIEAVKNGAVGYITSPFSRTAVQAALELARHQLHSTIRSRRSRERFRIQKGLGRLIGRSEGTLKLQKLVDKVSRSDSSILITGEQGTGKELIARTIHFQGGRAANPLLLFDCKSAVPSLRGSELFGHVKDAFRGAHTEQKGMLSLANKGTLILDEIAELPMELQTSLMRVIKEGKVRPIGASISLPLSVRIIATSSRNMSVLVERGRFRRDLYQFLNIVRIDVPPLRDRQEDIEELSAYFLERINHHSGLSKALSTEVARVLGQREWRGNVRELENAIEYACFYSTEGTIQPRDLPLAGFPEASPISAAPIQGNAPGTDKIDGTGAERFIARTFVDIERDAILSTLARTNGQVLEAAKLLQVGKTTIYRKLKEYGYCVSESTKSDKTESDLAMMRVD